MIEGTDGMDRQRKISRWLPASIAIAAVGFGAWTLWGDDRIEARGGGFLRDGEAGFVVTSFAYAVGPDAAAAGTCPDGMSKNVVEIFAETPAAARLPGEDDETYGKRLEAGGRAASELADGRNVCMFPASAPPDPHIRQLLDTAALADGIDLDGEISRTAADARARRLDFTSPVGVEGVDNQFWRAVGCNRSYQTDGQSNVYEIGMYAGEWGILISLADVDSVENDDHVEIGIHASADPLRLSPTRAALEFATYAWDPDPAFNATTTGRIVDGVLISEPVDVQFHHVTNSMYMIRPLHEARIHATIDAEGRLDGILGGFTPIEALYDFQFGYRNALNGDGTPAPEARRLQTSNGSARVLGHTCQGMWQSLHQLADGHPDANGRFTTISTQYRFEARPAFLVEPEDTAGNNAGNDDV